MNDTPLTENDLFGGTVSDAMRGDLAKRFGIPPFSVISARDGFWQTRKRDWIRLGIRSELGRGVNVTDSDITPGGRGPNSQYNRGAAKTFNMGMNANAENGWKTDDEHGSGTSIFDPVLCEMMYRWFCPDGGQIIDPFAGGSVRGLVAGCMGRRYWGCDLSVDQIHANREQIGVVPDGNPPPRWVIGDARNAVPNAPMADMVMACPPYFDLEVYSNAPSDLSNMPWDGFCESYSAIIAECAARLWDNRFAVFVIGDVRDDDGNFRNLPGFTTHAFRRAGMHLYNECILVTAVGSLPVRTGRQFVMSRKMGRTHQSVLIYVKGDARIATDAVTGMTRDERRAMLDKLSAARADGISNWGES